jgi:hypothetical protein
MKSVFNYTCNLFTVSLKFLSLLLFTIVSMCFVSSCDMDDLKIQKGAPFEVSVMPIPKEISKGQTIEIRLAILRKEKYSGTKYYIRYFQYDGQGSLQYYNEPSYQSNDSYLLPVEQFRLYYTSQSNVTQSFRVWIFDNFGNEKQLSFELNSSE